MTRIVNVKFEPFDLMIDRTTIWGNPFKIGVHGNRQQVIERYSKWVLTQPWFFDKIWELEGKTLGCWCVPLACHGHVLVDFIERIKECENCTKSDLLSLLSS